MKVTAPHGAGQLTRRRREIWPTFTEIDATLQIPGAELLPSAAAYRRRIQRRGDFARSVGRRAFMVSAVRGSPFSPFRFMAFLGMISITTPRGRRRGARR